MEDADFKIRIREYKLVRAAELAPHRYNFRRHPLAQREALTGALRELGYIDALGVVEVDGGYQIIDGHLRADISAEQIVPVLVLDLDEAESDKAIAIKDPIGAMAEEDAVLRRRLLGAIDSDDEDLRKWLEAERERLAELAPPEDFPTYGPDLETERQCPKCGYKFSGGKVSRE